MDREFRTVEIPGGEGCYMNMKPCILAAYSKRYGCYSCKLFSKLLKGGDSPEKCEECREYGKHGARPTGTAKLPA